ncbi:MAG: glutamate 5-kinase [Acidimicrobiia bacterium]|nr:glutamate 5-kinase [Acidimicrobiia bacterium]
MRAPVPAGGRVVVKVGSSSLATPDGGLDPVGVARAVEQVSALWDSGRPAVLVSSGAVAAGLPDLGLAERPSDIPGLQAAAAVGQGRLMERYAAAFGERERVVGQVLLTKDVLANRPQYLHAREALERLLGYSVVPIVNENDTVVVDELRLGDNDRLAAIVSHLVGASLLVILTDTAGLYASDPRLDADAELLTAVRHTDEILDELITDGTGPLGSGGVATKVAAARMAAWSGIPTVIASATDAAAALAAADGAEVGTWVAPHTSKLSSRKLWIAFGLPAAGTVVVDEGAVDALVNGGRSLLAVGVSAVRGRFDAWDGVEIEDPSGRLIAKGIVGIGSSELHDAAGKHSSETGGAVVHRDDLVVLI